MVDRNKLILHGGHWQQIKCEEDLKEESKKGNEQMSDDVLNDSFLMDIPDIPMPEGDADDGIIKDEVDSRL